ncbi:FliA/WhiG family RNA polymerase sigma factor [Clostridium sp. 'deep sea']|uniref:sigma-70 family RNA polymerase sigma factor n=1 Tax=Clostridium sp. 'deep sea' TaxID=2779445 RepID=UPI0018964DCB|nr:FliA/WhiG family RNA polymerase sigma factor [Clostridium sp. 'deep sea']QOR35358.1 FliA/WhiG family RNA polymerase sigma factor [Clostridium sp. 'deep sea']
MDNIHLWNEYNQTKNIECRNELVLQYLPIVQKIVNSQLYGSENIHVREEYYSNGIFGLIDAVHKYDSRKNVKFETYASIRIRGSIKDYMRMQDWLPRGVREKQKKIENAREKLSSKLLRNPSNQELAAETGMTISQVNKIIGKLTYSEIASFEELLNKGLNPVSRDPEDNLEQVIEKKELSQILANEIEKLTEKEQLVISLYYKEELKLKDIGKVLKISESRVSQIMKKAIQKLRKNISEYL